MIQPMNTKAHHFGGHYIGNPTLNNDDPSTPSTPSTPSKPSPTEIKRALPQSQFTDNWFANAFWMRTGLSSGTADRTGLETNTVTDTFDVTNTAVTLSQCGLNRRRANEEKAYYF